MSDYRIQMETRSNSSSGEGGGGKKLTTAKPYADVRQRAYQLESKLETAQDAYIQQLKQLIMKVQQQFYQQYKDELHELDKLNLAIQQYQQNGKLELNQQLTELLSVCDGTTEKETIRKRVNELYQTYQDKYFPEDDYQKKRDQEAITLRNAICGRRSDSSSSSFSRRSSYHLPPMSIASSEQEEDEELD